jgi:hypothetical protein
LGKDPGWPVIDSAPIGDPIPLLVGDDMNGGEDDIIAGGDDDAILGGNCPSGDVSTFGGRGNTVYMPIVAFPLSSADKSCRATPRWKNASVRLALSRASWVALRFCSTDSTICLA